MKKITFFCFFVLLVLSSVQAQQAPMDTSASYGIAALVKPESVVIRWAPRSYAVWRLGNKNGYVLERAEVPEKPGDLRKLAFQRVQPQPFKPYTLAEWKSKADTTNVAIGTAAQALYGQSMFGKNGASGMGLLHEQHNEQSLRHAFALQAAELNQQAAEGLGLRFEDKGLDKSKEYVYRIFNVPSTKGFVTDTAYVMVYPAFPQEPQSVLSAYLEEGDHNIKIAWSRPANRTLFSSYFVEKSSDGGKTFNRLNEYPLVFGFNEGQHEDFNLVDSQVVNGRAYQYRVIGVNSFAEFGLPSEVLTGMGKDLNAPLPPVELWANDIGNKFEISWKADHTLFADHAGWIIGRSLSANGPFAPLMEKPLPKETRKFVDENPVPLMTNYYVVFALDDKQNFNMSPVVGGIHHDAEAPAKPLGLKGVCDSTGLISLHWEAGKEPDIMGYRVFMATAKDREWFQITDQELPLEPHFEHRVKLNSLTEKVYFTVVAMDFSFNASEFAEMIEVALPDTIAPEKALINDYSASQKGILLKWAKSGSKDVVKTLLLRRNASDNNWKTLADVTAFAKTEFLDTSARQGMQYEYALETFDDAGLSSGKSITLSVAGADNGMRPGIKALQGVYDTKAKSFSLQWDYKPSGRYQFMIYRNIPGSAPEPIAQVPGSDRKFTDESLVSNKEGFQYAVKVIWADGGESDLSEPFEVRFSKGK
ncbi:MAG: fibronectin type III domain-containing protein [Saprospiraceae bacterium]|nr:fibronectin type III domain-containing protein [Saprospiraceae bacterium]